MEPTTFEINGVNYMTVPHDGMAGIPIFLEVIAAGSEPLLAFVKAQAEGGATDMQEVLKSLDVKEIGGAVREAIYRLAERPETLVALFSQTTRDGKPLSNSAAFKMAFQGRWMEMLQAAGQIAKINGFLPF
jgi:hypothetical protein